MSDHSVRLIKNGAPITSAAGWLTATRPAGGESQRRSGRSAQECADAWWNDGNPRVPDDIAALLASHPHTANADMEWAEPERRVRFDEFRGGVRNADVVALAHHAAGPIAVSVEAKADEAFARLVQQDLDAAIARLAAGKRTNMVRRVEQLAAALLPEPWDGAPPLGALRYQLLTAAAGALAFAAEVKATRAVLVVHEFVPEGPLNAQHDRNAADLDAFWTRLVGPGAPALVLGTLAGPVCGPWCSGCSGRIPLFVGKARTVMPRRPAPPA